MSDSAVNEIKLPAECCALCKFYLLVAARCRRYPPQIVVTGKAVGKSGGVNYQSEFPPLHPAGWCGEFSMLKV